MRLSYNKMLDYLRLLASLHSKFQNEYVIIISKTLVEV